MTVSFKLRGPCTFKLDQDASTRVPSRSVFVVRAMLQAQHSPKPDCYMCLCDVCARFRHPRCSLELTFLIEASRKVGLCSSVVLQDFCPPSVPLGCPKLVPRPTSAAFLSLQGCTVISPTCDSVVSRARGGHGTILVNDATRCTGRPTR